MGVRSWVLAILSLSLLLGIQGRRQVCGQTCGSGLVGDVCGGGETSGSHWLVGAFQSPGTRQGQRET